MNSEYGTTTVRKVADSVLFDGVKMPMSALMSHTDYVSRVPEGFKVTAVTDNCPAAAVEGVIKSPFRIVESRCIRCGACAVKCKPQAVIIKYAEA